MPKKAPTREFMPVILETKEDLVKALDDGKIKTTKYNTLTAEEKLFVQMIAFGNYSPAQAMRQVHPEYRDSWAAGKRWASRPAVADTLEELTYQRDKYWMNKISGSADKALRTLEYIMATTDDDALKAAVAKTIIESSHKTQTLRTKKEESIGGFRMVINVPVMPKAYNPDDIIDVDVVEGSSMVLSYAAASEKNSEE